VIAYLRGEVIAHTERGCILLTGGGVGYELSLTVPERASLPAQGESAEFFTYTIVREDALELYGFGTADERSTFETLLSIQRLGAKTAMAILSIFGPDDLRRIALTDDYAQLTSVPGIGKKSAQRIFIDLKYRLDVEPGRAAPSPDVPESAASAFRDALAGLVNLGYEESEAAETLSRVFKEEPDLEVSEALRKALKGMAGKRG
jgi:Holliday junction DNA helicase RuvA